MTNISRSKNNQTIKLGQSVDYDKKNIFLQKLCEKGGRETSPTHLSAFMFNAESFAIAFIVLFFLFYILVTFSGRTTKSLLVSILSFVIKKVCDEDLTHSLDTLSSLFVKIVSQVVIRDACGT